MAERPRTLDPGLVATQDSGKTAPVAGLVVGWQALLRLVPGGTLLVSRNDRKSRGGLEGLLQRAAKHAGVELADLQPAPAGREFPQLSGFPEGRPFEAVLATRE